MKITTTKEDLIKAFEIWNKDAIDNKEDYEDISGSVECAEDQVEELLKRLKQIKNK